MSDPLMQAQTILRSALDGRVRTEYPIAPLTSLRVGGPAALFLDVESQADLEAVADAVDRTGIDVVVIGKGSNLLVSDRGFPGLVVRLGKGYRWAAREGDRLVAGGAMPLPALAGVALAHRLTGLEFGVAIPATLGGGVRMNAGAHGRSMSDVVERIDIVSLADGRRTSVAASDARFSYRTSLLPGRGVVVGARVLLEPGDSATVRARMDEARDWRRRTQPLAEPNCGSVFKNPDGDHAARLLDEVGAKGLSVGGAAVSTKHSNFIVASPGATARDVVELIRNLQELVAARTDVHLETEVHLVGPFDVRPR